MTDDEWETLRNKCENGAFVLSMDLEEHLPKHVICRYVDIVPDDTVPLPESYVLIPHRNRDGLSSQRVMLPEDPKDMLELPVFDKFMDLPFASLYSDKTNRPKWDINPICQWLLEAPFTCPSTAWRAYRDLNAAYTARMIDEHPPLTFGTYSVDLRIHEMDTPVRVPDVCLIFGFQEIHPSQWRAPRELSAETDASSE